MKPNTEAMGEKPLLFTSLPPMISRKQTDGSEVGKLYQKRCIQSWHDANFHPISINSRSESYEHSIEQIAINRDASCITKKPLIYLEDLLSHASKRSANTPFCITNADICFNTASDLSEQVKGLPQGEILISRRLDITSIQHDNGEPYYFGFDFFAFHPCDAKNISTSMIFGAPWWDHLLPLLMHFQQCKVKQLPPGKFHHLLHYERWNPVTWRALGEQYKRELKARCNDDILNRLIDESELNYQKKLKPKLKKLAGALIPRIKIDATDPLLHDLSDLNLDYIDQISQAKP